MRIPQSRPSSAVAAGAIESVAQVTLHSRTAVPRPATNTKRLASKSATSIAESELIPVRFPESRKYLGAHVSAAGGLHTSFHNAQEIKANAFSLFIKPRTWSYRQLTSEDIAQFKMSLSASGVRPEHILPHAQYIINLGNPDPVKRSNAYAYFLDDLKRCEQLGLVLYNIHPGSSVGECSLPESAKLIADCINRALAETTEVKVVLEAMAGNTKDTVVGASFESLQEVLQHCEQKDRVGVCLDTCHIFAAGYDIRTAEGFDQVLKEFDTVVGLNRLMAMHLNDSKGELGCRKDRHENIGRGKIGIEAFRFIMNDSRFDNMPLVLETPIQNDDFSVWTREIEMLRGFEQQHQPRSKSEASKLTIETEHGTRNE